MKFEPYVFSSILVSLVKKYDNNIPHSQWTLFEKPILTRTLVWTAMNFWPSRVAAEGSSRQPTTTTRCASCVAPSSPGRAPTVFYDHMACVLAGKFIDTYFNAGCCCFIIMTTPRSHPHFPKDSQGDLRKSFLMIIEHCALSTYILQHVGGGFRRKSQTDDG
jgi:hypothetical protein